MSAGAKANAHGGADAERPPPAEDARFRSLFEASMDAILLTVPDGRILAVNAAAEAMFGRSEAEIVALGRSCLVDESDPRLVAALRERAATGRVRADIRALRRDGSAFEVEISSVLFTDATGEERTSMVIRDVTKRTRALAAARESEARFQALADAAFEGIVVHDRGRILAVNRAACDLFGYDEDQLKAMHVRDLVVPAEAERVQGIIEAGGEVAYETDVVVSAGTPLAVEVSGRPITFGGRPARVAAIRDVSVRRLAQRALEEQNARLRELDALKSQFVALVSHELRTPLTSIVAYLDVLLAGEAGPLRERQRRYAEVAARNARRLRRLVDDLLFVGRADTGDVVLHRSRLELVPLVEEAVAALQPLAAEAGVRLRAVASASPSVDGDRDRLLQVVDNLVGNALAFTKAGGAVEVRVGASSDTALLAVTDTGAGIPEEDLQRVFERFYRGRLATDSTAGAGLGLAVVAEIVAGHEGTIRVDSTLGAGSTFTVELPRAPRARAS